MMTQAEASAGAARGLKHLLELAGVPLEPAGNRCLDAAAADRLVRREEELEDPRRDRWSCFRADQSEAGKTGRLESPPVDQAAAGLLCRLAAAAQADPARPLIRLKPWPEGRPFAVHLSHDLDLVRKGDPGMGLRHLAGFWRDRRNAPLGLGKLSTWARTGGRLAADPYWQPDRWTQAEERRGFRSDWFVLASTGDNAVPYRLEEIAGDLRSLASRGHGIGLHGSAPSYREPQRLATEKRLLEQAMTREVGVVRQHNLSLAGFDTWRSQAEAGFSVDASLGFNEAAGWRAGTSFPIPSPAAGGLLLLPLTVMDGVLLLTPRGSLPEARRRCEALLAAAREAGGVAAFDWHGQTTDAADYPHYFEAYEALLDAVTASGAWVATASEIAGWWRRRAEALKAWAEGGEPGLPSGVLEAFHAPGHCPWKACDGTRCERAL